MSEAIVTIRDPHGQIEREIKIRVNGDNANFIIRSEHLEASFLRNIDPRMADLLDIASCIFAADSRIRRGGNTRGNFGQDWRRRLSIQFFVRDPAFWSQSEVTTALCEAVQFMSDDNVTFVFNQAQNLPSTQAVLDVGTDSPFFKAEDVILFSGGLDSLAGAYDRLSSREGNVILLTHFSAPKRMQYPKLLVDALKKRFPGRILWIPVSAHLRDASSRETTQRTRSLLFASLGYVTAKLSGARRLHFYENGIVSANLPVSAQVIGTMASRTTHPQTLSSLAALVNLISPDHIELANPYGGYSKAQVVARLSELGGAGLIRATVSCSHVREQTILHPHCGTCSQCLDRRFGILASGLQAHDPVEGYEIDVLTGARPKDEGRVLAVDWVRHALRLAKMTEIEFLTQFGAELTRLTSARPDLPCAEHARDIVVMHRIHGQGVERVLLQAVEGNSANIVSQRLDPTSLLRMILAEQTALPHQPAKPPPPVDPENLQIEYNDNIFPLQVSITGSP